MYYNLCMIHSVCEYIFLQCQPHTTTAPPKIRQRCNRNFSKNIYKKKSGFGGLGVACWPLVPKFAGSNPAEAVGFLRAKKSSARLPSEGK